MSELCRLAGRCYVRGRRRRGAQTQSRVGREACVQLGMQYGIAGGGCNNGNVVEWLDDNRLLISELFRLPRALR